ncbi:hypothetical protein [Delftia phage IME-DE1]|uniref:Uncharacterized protein n=1 Tax=Delftia phage IME-DE1 TaxID=1647385 RepID=A0A0F7IJV4_9CAUD|nr:hypothetical protein AU155_gp19 [Delftia phage IME-DE1]AKG94482.1 hypothetical protein [Delftia phage IME-DE1]
MSRKHLNETEATILRGEVFKATLVAALKGLGCKDVEFHGFDTIAAYKAAGVPNFNPALTRIQVIGFWPDSGATRKCSYSVDWMAFDSYLLGSDLGAVKSWATSIARDIAHERIHDVLSRATMSVPLNAF